MKDHPILFTGDNVLAIMTCAQCETITVEIVCPNCGSKERKKTQTRRVIKPQPEYAGRRGLESAGWEWKTKKAGLSSWPEIYKFSATLAEYCPYGKVGDKLWVGEGYRIEQYSFRRNCVGGKYLADNKEFWTEVYQREYDLIKNRKFPLRATSGRFMYKSLARLWIEITNIRVERVQDIDENGACAEGCELYTPKTNLGPERTFQRLWNSINAKPKPVTKNSKLARTLLNSETLNRIVGNIACYISYPWEEIHETRHYRGKNWYVIGNPWVWAITSKVTKVESD